jgi:hypothetical protein
LIDCSIVPADDASAGLWEIDENLCRSEFSPADGARHMAWRTALWERTKVSMQVAPKPHGRPAGFASDAADKTGRDKSTMTRAIARGEKIAPDVLDAVQGTALDTGAALDRLAKLAPDEQRQLVAEAKPPPAEPAAEGSSREGMVGPGVSLAPQRQVEGRSAPGEAVPWPLANTSPAAMGRLTKILSAHFLVGQVRPRCTAAAQYWAVSRRHFG